MQKKEKPKMMKLVKSCFVAAVAAGATLATMAEEPKLDAASAKIVERMKAMRLPKMEFKPPATISDAVDFFCEALNKYDSPDLPKEKRDFNFMFIMKSAVDAPVMPMVKATDISVYDALTLVCECVGYTFEVFTDPVARVMVMPKEYLDEDEKKVLLEMSAGKSGKESEVSRKNKSKQAFKSYRFCVDSTRDPTDCMQLSEFELIDADGKVIPSGKFELSFDARGGDDNFGDGEKPECAVDGKLDTKWLDFRAAHDRSAAHRSAVWIQFKFAEPRRLAGYRWYTANDDEDRDPRSWRLLGSNDGVKWIVVDKVEDFEATSDRKKLAFTAHL